MNADDSRSASVLGAEKEEGIVLVPHTHWDREWYEPHEVFRLRLVHMLDDVITRLENDRQFRFTLDGQSAAINDYLEIRPENRDRVSALVQNGQLAVGPFLILLDEFCCDGETIVRNLELGLRGAERLGTAMQVGYLPDMFGHIAQMPQILRGFGIGHAALWRGVPGSIDEHAFVWESTDGSAVRTEYLFDGYGNGLDMFAGEGQLAELSARYQEDTRSWFGTDPVLGLFGTDHMAPPPELMDWVRQHNNQVPESGAPGFQVATLAEYLDTFATDRSMLADLPIVVGELRSHARGNLLPGVFSIRTNLKAAMAEAELTLTQAERLDALYGEDDHRAFFDLAWYRVVESTAHDSITGCGVDETADQVAARLTSATAIGRAVTERVLETLSRDVPSDAFVVANTLPWARSVQVEVAVSAADGTGSSERQVLGEYETALGDERLSSQDLVKILRRIHGRELFGQQINDYRWGPDWLQFEVAEVPEGSFDLATLTNEINAVAAADPADQRTWRVVTSARSRQTIVLSAEVPALGHVAVRPTAISPAEQGVKVTQRRMTSDLVDVVVQDDGVLDITGADGTVLKGVGRLVDEGDRGDSYNYGPVARGTVLDTPSSTFIEVVADGPLRGTLEIERRYNLPQGVDPADRDRRLEKTNELVTRMRVEVRRGEPFVRLTLTLVNTVRDHRVRLHVPLGEAVAGSVGSGQFDATHRGRTAEGGWGEYPLPTFPATSFVSAGDAHVFLSKLTEYEVVGAETGDELALTLLRAVGLMSVNVHPLRDEPAGSEFPVPGAQYLGTEVTTRIAVMPHADGWEGADAAQWSEIFRHEPLVRRGESASGGSLPASVGGPELGGRAVLSSLRRVSHEALPTVEARIVSMSREDQEVSLDRLSGGQWTVTDMRGSVLDSEPSGMLGRGAVRTMRSPTGQRGVATSSGSDEVTM